MLISEVKGRHRHLFLEHGKVFKQVAPREGGRIKQEDDDLPCEYPKSYMLNEN